MAEFEKKYEEILEECRKMIDSTGLATARIIDSITRNSQLASSYTPEMREIFGSWLHLVTGELRENLGEETRKIDIRTIADKIGLTESTVLSLLLYMHRSGDIIIKEISIIKGSGNNTEICHELR